MLGAIKRPLLALVATIITTLVGARGIILPWLDALGPLLAMGFRRGRGGGFRSARRLKMGAFCLGDPLFARRRGRGGRLTELTDRGGRAGRYRNIRKFSLLGFRSSRFAASRASGGFGNLFLDRLRDASGGGAGARAARFLGVRRRIVVVFWRKGHVERSEKSGEGTWQAADPTLPRNFRRLRGRWPSD